MDHENDSVLEAAHHWDHCVYIGADWDPSQLALARDNVEGVDTVWGCFLF